MATIAALVLDIRGDTAQLVRSVESTQATLGRLDRGVAGVSTRLGSFSQLSIATGTAIGNFLGTLATKAVSALTRELGELVARGPQMAPVAASFDRLSAAAGLTADVMLTQVRVATQGLVTDLDVMAASNKALLLGLPVTETSMADLAKTAVTLGRAMGQDAKKSVDDLITALGRSSPQILDNLGLTVKAGEANEQYAAQMGIVGRELTATEKKLAFYNAAMAAAEQKVAEMGEVQLTLAEQVTRAKNVLSNWTDALGVAIARAPGLNAALDALVDAFEHAFSGDQAGRIETMTRLVDVLAGGLLFVAESALRVGRAGVEAFTHWVVQTAAVSQEVLRFGIVLSDVTTLLGTIGQATPGASREFERLAAAGQAASTSLRGMRDDLIDLSVTTLTGAAAMHGGFETALATIRQARAALAEAGGTAASAATPVAALATGLDGLGGDAQMTAKELAKFTAEIKGALRAEALLTRQLGNMGKVFSGVLTPAIQAAGSPDAGLRQFDAIVTGTIPGVVDLTTAAERAQNAFVELGLAADALGPPPITESVGLLESLDGALGQVEQSFINLSHVAGATFGGIAQDIAEVISVMRLAIQAGQDLKKALSERDFAAGVSGVLGAVGALDAATSSGGRARRIGGGALTGAKIGMAFGPIGAGVGAGVGALIGWARSTGPSDAEKEGRKVAGSFRQGLLDGLSVAQMAEVQEALLGPWQDASSAGAVIAVRDAYLAAGRSVEEALDAVNRLTEAEVLGGEAVLRVQREIQGVMDQVAAARDAELQKRAMLDETIAEFGFTESELPAALRNEALAETAERLLNQFSLLEEAGFDTEIVIGRMADTLNDFVARATEAGTQVPERFRPILEQMRQQGLLTDAAGEKLESLEGIAFGDELVPQFDRLLEKLNELIDAIRGTSDAVQQIPTQVDIGFSAHGLEEMRTKFGDDLFGDWIAQMGDEQLRGRVGAVQSFATGGIVQAASRFGSGATGIVAHAGEGVLSTRGMEAFDALNAGRAPGGSDAALVGALDGLRTSFDRRFAGVERALQHLDRRIGRAVADAMATG